MANDILTDTEATMFHNSFVAGLNDTFPQTSESQEEGELIAEAWLAGDNARRTKISE